MKIAAVQMISDSTLEPNLATAARLVAEAAAMGARLVVLPEYFLWIGAPQDESWLASRELPGKGPVQDFLAATAREFGVWLVGGSIPLAVPDSPKAWNSCLVFDDQGRQVARYDKMHLFHFTKGKEHYDEAATMEPGHRVATLDTPFGHLGLAICYDLRFPELFRAMKGVDLLAIPAAFAETTGRAHWEMLLRARAVENQCYVVAAAQGGHHPTGRVTHGNSMIVDPWGDIVARMDKGEGVIVAELHAERLAEVRASLPALKHRRL